MTALNPAATAPSQRGGGDSAPANLTANGSLGQAQLAWQAAGGGIAKEIPSIDVYCPPGQSRVVRVAAPGQSAVGLASS